MDIPKVETYTRNEGDEVEMLEYISTLKKMEPGVNTYTWEKSYLGDVFKMITSNVVEAIGRVAKSEFVNTESITTCIIQLYPNIASNIVCNNITIDTTYADVQIKYDNIKIIETSTTNPKKQESSSFIFKVQLFPKFQLLQNVPCHVYITLGFLVKIVESTPKLHTGSTKKVHYINYVEPVNQPIQLAISKPLHVKPIISKPVNTGELLTPAQAIANLRNLKTRLPSNKVPITPNISTIPLSSTLLADVKSPRKGITYKPSVKAIIDEPPTNVQTQVPLIKSLEILPIQTNISVTGSRTILISPTQPIQPIHKSNPFKDSQTSQLIQPEIIPLKPQVTQPLQQSTTFKTTPRLLKQQQVSHVTQLVQPQQSQQSQHNLPQSILQTTQQQLTEIVQPPIQLQHKSVLASLHTQKQPLQETKQVIQSPQQQLQKMPTSVPSPVIKSALPSFVRFGDLYMSQLIGNWAWLSKIGTRGDAKISWDIVPRTSVNNTCKKESDLKNINSTDRICIVTSWLETIIVDQLFRIQRISTHATATVLFSKVPTIHGSCRLELVQLGSLLRNGTYEGQVEYCKYAQCLVEIKVVLDKNKNDYATYLIGLVPPKTGLPRKMPLSVIVWGFKGKIDSIGIVPQYGRGKIAPRNLRVDELRILARKMGIVNRSKMNKAELIRACTGR